MNQFGTLQIQSLEGKTSQTEYGKLSVLDDIIHTLIVGVEVSFEPTRNGLAWEPLSERKNMEGCLRAFLAGQIEPLLAETNTCQFFALVASI